MEYTIQVKRIEERPYVGIRRRVKVQEIGRALAEILPTVGTYLREIGVRPASPPITLYHAHHEAEGEFDIQGGWFLSAPIAGDDRFQAGIVPEGEVATTTHVGPYDRLGDAHSAIEAWIGRNGRSTSGPCWEIYLNDPGTVSDPNHYETEVSWPLR